MSNSSSAFAIEHAMVNYHFRIPQLVFMHSKDVFSLSETKDDALFDLGGAIKLVSLIIHHRPVVHLSMTQRQNGFDFTMVPSGRWLQSINTGLVLQ